MLRTAAALLAVPALAVSATATAAPSRTVHATVATADPHGESITLTQGGNDAGHLTVKPCVNTSPTAIVCSGHGTVLGLGPAKVRIRWHCPVGRTCEGHAEGTLKNHGSTLALLHVKAGVARFQSAGATFKVGVETVGE